MQIFRHTADLRRALAGVQQGTSVGFVPTMGFFHEGHLSLMRAAVDGNDVVVASVFVNPLQFGEAEDFESYPSDIRADRVLAKSVGITHLFVPVTRQMYPSGRPETKIEVGRIGQVCEGRYRPGHFSGVATVCVKLFNIVRPDRAYFGEKDAQQLAVIRQVVRDLDIPIEIVACPIERDPSGLALSSRNSRLSPEGLKAAAALYRALSYAARLASDGEVSAEALKKAATSELQAESRVSLQYLEVVDEATFEPVEETGETTLMALAAFVEGVRLIDNVKLT